MMCYLVTIGETMLVKLLEDFNFGSLLRLKGDVVEVEPNEGAWLIEHRKAEALPEVKEQDDPEGVKIAEVEKKVVKRGRK